MATTDPAQTDLGFSDPDPRRSGPLDRLPAIVIPVVSVLLAFAIGGILNPTLGGIPNRPEMNLEAALQPRQVMGTFASAWVPNPLPAQRHRRSLYALKIRVPGRTNLSRPTCRCASRIPSQGRDSRYGNNPNLIPLCTEPASSCVAIASIVARTAQHKHTSTTCLLKDLTSHLSDFSRRLLHQI